jgi:hypothetical protein
MAHLLAEETWNEIVLLANCTDLRSLSLFRPTTNSAQRRLLSRIRVPHNFDELKECIEEKALGPYVTEIFVSFRLEDPHPDLLHFGAMVKQFINLQRCTFRGVTFTPPLLACFEWEQLRMSTISTRSCRSVEHLLVCVPALYELDLGYDTQAQGPAHRALLMVVNKLKVHNADFTLNVLDDSVDWGQVEILGLVGLGFISIGKRR